MSKYKLSESQIGRVSSMEEFANGGAQVSVRLRDGRIFREVLISNSTWVVTIRGFDNLPFKLEEIDEIFQTGEDKIPGIGEDGDIGTIGNNPSLVSRHNRMLVRPIVSRLQDL